MNQKILVRLRNKRDRLTAELSPQEKIDKKDMVIIETKDGLEIGESILVKNCDLINFPQTKFVRVANVADIARLHKIQQIEEEYSQIFKDKIKECELAMKLIHTELSFDEKRLTFYFSAATRIDFRQLLKDLVTSCRKLIRLEQISARDAIKINEEYLGVCGRQVCCQAFLNNAKSVNLDMVHQENSKGFQNPKLSGCCGKLMCCLMFNNSQQIKTKNNEPLDKKK